jgi:methylmalonyl-CoA/ethylmalonyl-CoA epimerase
MAFFDCAGIRLMLGAPEDASVAKPATILYYKVDDIHGAFAELERQGVAVAGKPHLVAKMPTHDLWMAFLRDSEENTF